jgi:hypothetical protein
MTEKDDREQQKAELLWKYVEELKQTEDPNEVQFVAVTSGECAEVVGLMETAAEAYVLARGDAALHCRREAVRQRVQAAIADAALSPPRASPAVVPAAPRSVTLPAWLTAPLTGRSAGWVVAVAALMALLWVGLPRPEPAVVPMRHTAAVKAIPKLIEGRLDAEDTRALWAHIMRCQECMDLYQEALKAARSEAPPTRQSHLPMGLRMGARSPGAVVWSSTPGYLWVASAPGSR